jgi:hypothetical protein
LGLTDANGAGIIPENTRADDGRTGEGERDLDGDEFRAVGNVD